MLFRQIVWLVIALSFLDLTSTAKPPAHVSGRIVGGDLTTIDKVPYMVQIWCKGKFNCGGALLTRRFVLSAAHCFKNVTPSDLFVVAGATTLSETGGIRSNVIKIMMPASFSTATMDNDVAVLKLATALHGPNTQTIGLYNDNLKIGQQVEISGWGRTSEMGDVSFQLRTIRVPVLARPQCRQQYSKYIALTKNMFCAGLPGAKDSCSGDSGGPVVANGKICGIVSFGVGCARQGLPGVYTKIKE
ncbi:seminase-like, partial [Musca vetustissima]|uniref:seminase-like n=1 Tax=Musca vetustissima TaxID=27455 RepID=UPI002AB6A460